MVKVFVPGLGRCLRPAAAWALAIGAMLLTTSASMVAQAPASAVQRDLDPAFVRTGAGLFRERCAECHGADAKGVAGHDLTQLWASGATDERVSQTIRAGVPNTLMPSSTAPDDELRALVTYLRSLNGSPAAARDRRAEITDNGERDVLGFVRDHATP